MDYIVHICTRRDWAEAQEGSDYRAESLETEGFIHCSRPNQVLKVANHFYSRVGDLVLLWIDPQKLDAGVRWEYADGDVFPHLYGVLNFQAVVSVIDYPPDPDGVFRTVPDPV